MSVPALLNTNLLGHLRHVRGATGEGGRSERTVLKSRFLNSSEQGFALFGATPEHSPLSASSSELLFLCAVDTLDPTPLRPHQHHQRLRGAKAEGSRKRKAKGARREGGGEGGSGASNFRRD